MDNDITARCDIVCHGVLQFEKKGQKGKCDESVRPFFIYTHKINSLPFEY